MKKLIIFLVCLLWCVNAWGVNLYVTQNGVGDGLTSGAPDSIADFNAGNGEFANPLDGDTVYFGGTITTTINPPDSGTSGNEITLSGDYPSNPCTVTPGANQGIYLPNDSYIIIRDFIVNAGTNCITLNNSDNCQIISNTLSGNTSTNGALFVSGGSDNCIATNNTIMQRTGVRALYALQSDNFTLNTQIMMGADVAVPNGNPIHINDCEGFDINGIAYSGWEFSGTSILINNGEGTNTLDDLTFSSSLTNEGQVLVRNKNNGSGSTTITNIFLASSLAGRSSFDIRSSNNTNLVNCDSDSSSVVGVRWSDDGDTEGGSTGTMADCDISNSAHQGVLLTDDTAGTDDASAVIMTFCTVTDSALNDVQIDQGHTLTFDQGIIDGGDGDGLHLSDGNGVLLATATITRSIIRNVGPIPFVTSKGDGITAHGDCVLNVFECLIYNNLNTGIGVSEGVLGGDEPICTIYNSTIVNNGSTSYAATDGRSGVYFVLDDDNKFTFKNNIVVNNYPRDIKTKANGYTNNVDQFDYNCYNRIAGTRYIVVGDADLDNDGTDESITVASFINNGAEHDAEWYFSTEGNESNSVNAGGSPWLYDPRLVNVISGNFRILANSPCRDTAIDVGLTLDIAGTLLPQGIGFDMGSYEYILKGIVVPIINTVVTNIVLGVIN